MKSRSLLWSFNYAIDGIVYTLRTQRNMRVHVAMAAAVAVGAPFLGVRGLGLVSVIFAISLVFVTELLNTAIEAAVDVATEHFDPIAKVAKDVAAGAVLISAINALVVAYLVLFDPLRALVSDGMRFVRFSTTDLSVIALGIVLIVVLIMKAISKEGTWLRGGWPSGHAAIAFAAATMIGFVTASSGALVVAFFIAALVVQSRVEAGFHTVAQSALGSLVGIVLTTLVFQMFYW